MCLMDRPLNYSLWDIYLLEQIKLFYIKYPIRDMFLNRKLFIESN